jgi:hypothetical protein
MITHLYTTCWNEADMLPFFFRHYDPWIDRYVVFDNGSTDASLDRLREHPRVEVRSFPWSRAESFVLSQQDLYNTVWKESRGAADWVVITAIDEHLHVPRQSMKDFLMRCAKAQVTCVPALGYQMLSEDFPQAHETLCITRTRGAPWDLMSKLSLFNPNAVEETRYQTGRHKAYPRGRIVFPGRDELLLLHYKYMGFERTYRRHTQQLSGLRPHDLSKQWGHQYAFSRNELRWRWDDFASEAVDISDPQLRPWATHSEERWWRSRLFNLKSRVRRRSQQRCQAIRRWFFPA